MGCLDNDFQIHSVDKVRLWIEIILMSSIFSGNVFIIFSVLRNCLKQGWFNGNKTNVLLVINLSTADMLFAVFNVYNLLPKYHCDLAEDLKYYFVPCILRFSLLTTAHLVSVGTLTAIAVDRYIAVVHPVRYGHISHARRTWCAIAGIWTCAILISSIPFFWNNWVEGKHCKTADLIPPGHFAFLFIPQVTFVVVASTLYWRIHGVALEIRERTQRMSLAEKMNTKSARGLMIIIGVYLVTWLPFMVMLTLAQVQVRIPHTVFEVFALIVDINYLVNPFIYAYNTRPVRNAMRNALCCIKEKRAELVVMTGSNTSESAL